MGSDESRRKEDRVKMTVEVPRSLWRAAKIRAAEEERDLREIVIDGLTLYLAGKKKGAGDAR